MSRATCKIKVYNIATGIETIGTMWYSPMAAKAHCRSMNDFDSNNRYSVWQPSWTR